MHENQTIKLLITARNPGAAQQLVAFAMWCVENTSEVVIQLITQGPASKIVQACPALATVRHLILRGDAENDPKVIESFIKQWQPDFVLVGLAYPESGVDEWACQSALQCGIAVGAMQDYWGYLGNFSAESCPQLFFVFDSTAKELTERKLCGRTEIAIVGSPKHERYRNLDFDRMLGEKNLDARPLLLFCGQPDFIPGYRENVAALARALGSLGAPVRFMLRLHPEDEQKESYYAELFQNFCPQVTLKFADQSVAIEEQLVAADYVITCFSTAGFDHAYLQLYAPKPLGIVLYVTIGAKIQDFLRSQLNSIELPPVCQGFGKQVFSEAALESTLSTMLHDEDMAEAYRRQVLEKLAGHENAAKNLWLALKDFLGRV